MAERRDGGSPPGRERAEQEIHGRAGGERAPGGEGRGQVRQGSQRAETKTERKTAGGFEPGHAPSEQGHQGKPKPEEIARHQAGMKASAGHRTAHGQRNEESAQAGEPESEHTRGGRQEVSGDRDPQQPS
jgi:hypothetical protein